MDAQTLIDMVESVTKKWTKQQKAEERHRAARCRRHEALTRSRRTTIKEAAWGVMEAAYLKASNRGQYPAHARQVMYAARGDIQRATGKQLDDQYFTQTLLPDYLNENPEQTANWDVVFDARGHFEEPHTELVVPLGTLHVRKYLRDARAHKVGDLEVALADKLFPTCGPAHRFGAVLFIEKEGFMPLFKEVKLAERYDIAIMSTKGLSVTASRALVDRLCDRGGVPLLVLHDFDKSGFSIVGTLRRDTRRYQFANEVQVIDLGLRLADVEECGLECEDVCYGKTDPTWNLRKNGATKEEIEFLCGDGDQGMRVELNAFTSGDLVEWIESKLEGCGVKKVVPDDKTLEAAYRRALYLSKVQQGVGKLVEQVGEEVRVAEVPKDLAERVREGLEESPECPWDEVIASLVAEERDGESEG